MNSTSKKVLISSVIIIVLAILAYFAWQERQGSPVPSPTTSTSTSTGVSITVSSSTASTSTPGYTITQVPIGTSTAPAAPDYKTPLTFSSDFTADEQTSYESQFATIQTTLASTPTDWSSWIDLGILRKNTGDYAGASADWKYVTEIYPQDPTAFADLGDLYANDLNEPTQGIAYYKQAIALSPTTQESFYENLAEIYEAQGDTADAKATLQQGINAKVVGYQNLQSDLDTLQ